jgi:hypothetical protein
MVTHTSPVAVQRGKTITVAVFGQMNFAGIYKALFQGQGIKAEIIPLRGPKPLPKRKGKFPVRQVHLKLTVDAAASLGVREFRLASNLGVSSIGQVVVVDDPVVVKKGNNNTPARANRIPVPCVVAGRIDRRENVDYYRFHAKAGQTLTFEVLCARLQDKIHDLQKHADPILTLFDAAGRELAANDDFYFADPMLSYRFARTGDYLLQVRDAKYDGDPRWAYALFVTDRPYVSHAYPMAGNPGKTIAVEPVGSAHLLQPRVQLRVPARAGVQTVRLAINGVKTNPTAFIVSSLPQVLEQEPNDTPAKANRVTIPCGINGRIQSPRDLDHFVFAAKKGRAIRFEVKARRFNTPLCSSLDSVLDVMNSKGVVLASNDDTYSKDAALVFQPPADGDYVLRIRDLNNKGGATAVYYIEADWARPDFTLRCDPDKAMIGPGSSTAWYVHVLRQSGFAGAVRVEVKGLPPGVTASPLTIPPTMTQGVLVLTAGPAARKDAVNVEVVGTGVVKHPHGKQETLVRRATPNQEIYFPGGGRGLLDVSMQTVAVTDPSDILRVEVKPQVVTLKPGEEVRIDVTLHRRKDFKGKVSLDVLLRHLGGVFGNPLPPGVTIVSGKSKTLLGGGSKGYVTLKAAPTARAIDKVPIGILAHVSINFVVKVSYSSPPILVTVQPK